MNSECSHYTSSCVLPKKALEDHLGNYVGKLLKKTGPRAKEHGLTTLHMDKDIYFPANRTDAAIKVDCGFRVGQGSPQLWDPVTGEQRPLPQFEQTDGLTSIPMQFDAFQSYFVVFDRWGKAPASNTEKNFPELKAIQEISGAWEVVFDPKWGGPEKISFDSLHDWTTHPEPGIKYYSGVAIYRKPFNVTQAPSGKTYLDLGVVHDMARVKLNGKDLGVVWCAPWRVEVTGAIKTGYNPLEIAVVNRWANRLIGDKQAGNAEIGTAASPPGFLDGKPFMAGRYTFTTHDPYKQDSALLPSGLIGPVTLRRSMGPA